MLRQLWRIIKTGRRGMWTYGALRGVDQIRFLLRPKNFSDALCKQWNLGPSKRATKEQG